MDIHNFIKQNNNSIKQSIKELNKRIITIEHDYGLKDYYFICKTCNQLECSDTINIFEAEMYIPIEIIDYLKSL